MSLAAIIRRGVLAALCVLAVMTLQSFPAVALEPIPVTAAQDRVDITRSGELYEKRGDRLSVETAAGRDGVTGRMSVAAATPGTNPNWVVFALSNAGEQPVSLWLTAERYDIVGSRALWPDLDAPRLAALTPSLGFRPERGDNEYADIFKLTIDPGTTVTYIAEVASAGFPRLSLLAPAAYGKKLRDETLFNGILLGIAGFLALFLTAIYAASHRAVFPATALVAWSIVAYLCVDFGFFHKLLKLPAGDNGTYRAATEAALATSLVVFLYTFLRLRLWHGWLALVFAVWVAAQAALIGFAVIDAKLAAGLARLSFLAIAAVGTTLITFLSLRGQERALALVPSWLLFLVWMLAASVMISGQLSGDLAVAALTGGLVLILVMISFTVTQFVFHAGDGSTGGDAGQFQLRMEALEASGASVWEWNTRRDEISAGAEIDQALGYAPGTLRGPLEDWLGHLHTADRERLKLTLWTVRERASGDVSTEFRMARADGGYNWLELRARAMDAKTGRPLRCVGLIRDVTVQKRAQERLMRNAVTDSLTGLPNRELFLDRVGRAVARARAEGSKPTLLFIDIDSFKALARSSDAIVTDSMLLTISRRLSRYVEPDDTLGRIGSEQFAILVAGESEPRQIAMLAERVRRALRSPMKIAGRDAVLTGSVGIAVFDGSQARPDDLLREAEAAMYAAKRAGADRIELFKPEMRSSRDDRDAVGRDLAHAIERRQIKLLFQPIMQIGDDQLAGFEAVVRWEHPKLGRLSQAEFMPMAEEPALAAALTAYVLERATRQVARWHKALRRDEAPLFVSVNIDSRQFFRADLVQELRLVIGREAVPKGCLRLEVPETIVMENPEHAIEVLDWLRGIGAGLALDDFGAGYSSLSYLPRLPVDTIKIDRGLVALGPAGSAEERGPAALRAALAMARELGKDVVAVGVEKESDIAFLRALGFEFAQGPCYGEPMSDRDVMALLAALAKRVRGSKRKDAEAEDEVADGDTVAAASNGVLPVPAAALPPPQINGAPRPAAASAAPGSRVPPALPAPRRSAPAGSAGPPQQNFDLPMLPDDDGTAVPRVPVAAIAPAAPRAGLRGRLGGLVGAPPPLVAPSAPRSAEPAAPPRNGSRGAEPGKPRPPASAPTAAGRPAPVAANSGARPTLRQPPPPRREG